MAAKRFFILLALVAIQRAHSAPVSFKWCVTSSAEGAKCQDFIKYVNEIALNKSLDVSASCVEGSSYDDCAAKIKDNKADLVTLDGGHVYAAGKNNSMVPIVAEQYGNLKYGVKHYAVAVVKKSNTGFNLKSLKGKNSCHSGARTVEGWNVPIGYMLREKIIAPVRCDTEFHDFYSVANFFEWSCVPGLMSYKIASEEVSDKLCGLCTISLDVCSASSSGNAFTGNDGALECMAAGQGDVAFVKHTTLQEAADKNPKWNVSDYQHYQYLCKDGTREEIGQHENCFLGFDPAHAVVTRKNNKDIDDIVTILTAMGRIFGPNQTDWTKFQLFNSTKYKGTNLMFKDSSTALVSIPKDNRTYQGYLGDDYVKDTEALKTCETSTTKRPTFISFTTITPHARMPSNGSSFSNAYYLINLFIFLFFKDL